MKETHPVGQVKKKKTNLFPEIDNLNNSKITFLTRLEIHFL